jgi:hypothetical protein
MPAATLELAAPSGLLAPRVMRRAAHSGTARPARMSGPHPLIRAGHEPGPLGLVWDVVEAAALAITLWILRQVIRRL